MPKITALHIIRIKMNIKITFSSHTCMSVKGETRFACMADHAPTYSKIACEPGLTAVTRD